MIDLTKGLHNRDLFQQMDFFEIWSKVGYDRKALLETGTGFSKSKFRFSLPEPEFSDCIPVPVYPEPDFSKLIPVPAFPENKD